MILTLDGNMIQSDEAFHDAVLDASGIGYYGCNLDALWDLLTGLVTPPVRIEWTHAKASEDAMGEDFRAIVEVIRDAAGTFPNDIHFEMSE